MAVASIAINVFVYYPLNIGHGVGYLKWLEVVIGAGAWNGPSHLAQRFIFQYQQLKNDIFIRSHTHFIYNFHSL